MSASEQVSLDQPQPGAKRGASHRALAVFALVVAGGLAVLGFAPFALFPLTILALALLADLTYRLAPGRAFVAGWDFGLGLLGFGVAWIRISLNQFGNLDAPLAWLLTLLFIGAMAVYFGVAGWATRMLRAPSQWVHFGLIFPSVWVLVEWVRGWLFTGFPWLAIGYSQIDSPLGGYAPSIGVYGVSWVAVLSAGMLALTYRLSRRGRLLALAVLALAWLGGIGLRSLSWAEATGEPIRASLVQANIPQSVKWDPDRLLPTLRAYLDLTQQSWGSQVIVWPETAVPDFQHRVQETLLAPLGEKATKEGAEVIVGVPVLDQESHRYYNAVASLGTVQDLYFKRHLVPFGEFLPFKNWLGPLVALFEVPMSDFSAGTASTPLLEVDGYGVGVSVCYEDAFPEEVIQALPEAAFLVNLSNDAWFGDSLAPHQHLDIARMRALESQRYLLRATNTGVSAIIGPDGKVLASLALDQQGVVTSEIQRLEGATPFVRWGNRPIVAVSMIVLLGGLGWRLRRSSSG